MTNTNNELNDFQKKVFTEYELNKSFEKSENRINETRDKQRKGCLSVPIAVLADLFVSRTIGRERQKRNYAGHKWKAEELLRQQEISDRICQTFAEIDSVEILTEEKFVYKLTGALYRSDLASRLIIPEIALLYAMMATEVFNVGLESFCGNNKGGK